MKRYELGEESSSEHDMDTCSRCITTLCEDAMGDWVRYADAAEEIARRDAEIERLRVWQKEIMSVLPVGNIQEHTPENAVSIIKTVMDWAAQSDFLDAEIELLKAQLAACAKHDEPI